MFSLLYVSGAIAQPVFQNTQSPPALGYTVNAKTASIPAAGLGGAATTWDFSTYSFSQMATATFVDPASTTYVNFNSATHAFKINGMEMFTFFIKDQDSMVTLGADILGFNGKDYRQNPSKQLQFPMAYGDSFYDEYKKAGSSVDNFTATYDGYGTLIIDGNTYNNVARVNYNYSGDTDYIYWVMSPLFPVLVISNGNGTYFDHANASVGIEVPEDDASINIYPVPATDVLVVEFSDWQETGKEISIEVYNAIGELVISEPLKENSSKLSVAGLTPGTYFYQIRSENWRSKSGSISIQ